jgi:ATP-dependent protease ClpP protease subunit
MKNQNEQNKNYPYKVDGENGKISVFLYGEIGEGRKADPLSVVSAIMELRTGEEAELHINSNGGDVFGGISIYNALKNTPANISIYIDGVAASMAGVIALCGKPLYMGKYSRLMLHRVSGGAYGNAQELSEVITQMKAIEDDLSSILAQKCKMTPEEVKNRFFNGKDHWLTAKEASDLGFVDGIITGESIVTKEDTPEGVYNAVISRFEARFSIFQPEDLYTRISKLPAFKDMDEDTVFECIKKVKPQTLKNMLDNALAKGIINKQEKEEMSVAYKNNLLLLQKTLESREQRFNNTFETKYYNILKESNNHILLADKEFVNGELKQMAKTNFEAFERLMKGIKKPLRVRDFICEDTSVNDKDRKNWTLDDYRKKAPNELRKNPELYNRLLVSEK